MRKTQWRSLKFYSLLLLSLAAIVMFEPSCTLEETENYPSARFVLKGTILADTLEQPLEGIIVVMQEYREVAGTEIPKRTILVPIDSAVTDANGFFEVIDSLGIPAETAYNLAVIDTGKLLKASGERIDTSITCTFTKLKFTNGDGHWFAGETLKTDTFRLEIKSE